MGKRRRERPTGSKADWGQEEEDALLGLLDFCIKHKEVFPFNEKNVVGRLCFEGNPSKMYTWNQITRKLANLLEHWGRDDCLSKTDIYEKGSACIAFSSEHEPKAIKLEAERWEKELHLPTAKKKLARVPIANRTTSITPSTLERSQRYTSEYNTSGTERLTPRSQRYQTRVLASQSKWEFESLESSFDEEEAPRKRTRQNERGTGTRLNQRHMNMSSNTFRHRQKFGEENEQQENQRLKSLLNDTRGLGQDIVIIEDSDQELSSGYETNNNLLGVCRSDGSSMKKPRLFRLGSEVRHLQGDPIPSPATLDRIYNAALRKKDEQIQELEEKLSTNERKFEEVQAQLDYFQSAQEKPEGGEDSLELLIPSLNQEIAHLKNAMQNCRQLGTFTKLAGSYQAARREMSMETQILSIRHLMKNIFGGCDDDTKLKFPGQSLTSGLRELLSFGFGFDDQAPLPKEQFDALVLKHPPYSTIETLIEAAVCVWVFESSFPNFAQEPGVLDLFTKYKEIIATQDGAVALGNLDIASHHDLINAPRFHRIMEKEAKDLANSFSKTLAPLFARNAAESEENGFETWGEAKSVWKSRQDRLITIFKKSLKLKATSVLTPERYELVHYAPDTIYNSTTMDVKTIEGALIDAPAGEGYRVEHCQHVAIQAYTREPVKDTDPASTATIEYRNFTRGDTTQDLGALAPIVLVKAVVVLKRIPKEEV